MPSYSPAPPLSLVPSNCLPNFMLFCRTFGPMKKTLPNGSANRKRRPQVFDILSTDDRHLNICGSLSLSQHSINPCINRPSSHKCYHNINSMQSNSTSQQTHISTPPLTLTQQTHITTPPLSLTLTLTLTFSFIRRCQGCHWLWCREKRCQQHSRTACRPHDHHHDPTA